MRLDLLPAHLSGCVVGSLTRVGCNSEDILWLSAPHNAAALLDWITKEGELSVERREQFPEFEIRVTHVCGAETLPFPRLSNLLQALAHAGATEQFIGWLQTGDNSSRVLAWIRSRRGFFQENPYTQTVEEQMRQVVAFNETSAGEYKLSTEQIDRLGEEAPDWPRGRRVFRSLELRVGGVFDTFIQHVMLIKAVFGKAFQARLPAPPRPSLHDTLKLVSGEHRLGFRWVVFDADLGRERSGVHDAQRFTSLSDAGLALLWLNPDYAVSIGQDSPGMLLAGYRAAVYDPFGTHRHIRVPGVVRERSGATLKSPNGLLVLDFFAETDVDPSRGVPWTRF